MFTEPDTHRSGDQQKAGMKVEVASRSDGGHKTQPQSAATFQSEGLATAERVDDSSTAAAEAKSCARLNAPRKCSEPTVWDPLAGATRVEVALFVGLERCAMRYARLVGLPASRCPVV